MGWCGVLSVGGMVWCVECWWDGVVWCVECWIKCCGVGGGGTEMVADMTGIKVVVCSSDNCDDNMMVEII